jgi:preprotein translocase subunit YajC
MPGVRRLARGGRGHTLSVSIFQGFFVPQTFILLAQDPAPTGDGKAGQQPPPGLGGMAFPLIVMMIAMFCFMVLPARRQRKEQEAMMASLKAGTKVQTAGGILGTIERIKDGEDEVVLRSEGTRLKVTRGSIARVLGQDETEAK